MPIGAISVASLTIVWWLYQGVI